MSFSLTTDGFEIHRGVFSAAQIEALRAEANAIAAAAGSACVRHLRSRSAVFDELSVTLRLHLDETPESNGALRVIPRSHKPGKMSARAAGCVDTDQVVFCECSSGDVLLMSPLLLHSSRRSVQPTRHRVAHFEYARESDLDPRLNWFENEAT